MEVDVLTGAKLIRYRASVIEVMGVVTMVAVIAIEDTARS